MKKGRRDISPSLTVFIYKFASAYVTRNTKAQYKERMKII